MKTISIPTNDRPHYLQRILDSIRAQPEAAEYTLVFSCEPGCPEVHAMVGRISWAPTFVSFNSVRRGPDLNPFLAVATAMAIGSEFNVYQEEDFMQAPDALKLANAFAASKSQDQNSILVFRRAIEAPERPDIVGCSGRGDGLMGSGFCIRPEMFPLLQRCWFQPDPITGHNGWDWSLGGFAEFLRWRVWRPMVNRTQHIGVEGTNANPSNYHNPPLSGPAFTGRVEDFTFIES